MRVGVFHCHLMQILGAPGRRESKVHDGPCSPACNRAQPWTHHESTALKGVCFFARCTLPSRKRSWRIRIQQSIYECVYKYMYRHMCMYVHLCTYMHLLYIYICMCICNVYMYIAFTHTSTHKYIYIYMYIYMYIYIHMQDEPPACEKPEKVDHVGRPSEK